MKILPIAALAFCMSGTGFSFAGTAATKMDDEGGFIVDTSLPFASGAREHFIPVRLPFGLPTFQQGFVDGMHYRIDPDGGALFSPDPRLRNDVFEVECDGGVTTCVAYRDIIRLTIDDRGGVSLSLDNTMADESVYLGYGDFAADRNRDSWKLLNISVDMLTVDYLADYAKLVVVQDGKLKSQTSLEGISVIEAYLKWVWKRQAPHELPASWADAHASDGVKSTKLTEPVSLKKTTIIDDRGAPNWTLYSPELQFPIETFIASADTEGFSENSIIGKTIRQAKLRTKPQLPDTYSDPSEALKGLPGIYVFTDYLAEPVHLKGKFSSRVHDAIEKRLKAGGIRVLSKSELMNTPGQPRMEVFFSKVNTITGFSFAVWISVRQSTLLGRDEKVRLLSGTWGSGGAHLRKYIDAPEFNTIMNHVDRFIAAYKKANS